MKTFTSVFLMGLLIPLTANLSLRATQDVPANSPAAKQAAPPSESSSSKKKSKPVPSFLILGTVFNENALSLAGVRVRIRQAGGRKYRWETYTNSRGEFAVRVPPGYDYEVTIRFKNYADQARTVDSKVDVQQRLSIQLKPLGEANSGAKP